MRHKLISLANKWIARSIRLETMALEEPKKREIYLAKSKTYHYVAMDLYELNEDRAT